MRLLERALAADHGAHRDLGAGEVDRRARDVDLALADHLADRGLVHEHVVHRRLERVGVDPLRHRQVALRVHVDAEDAEALLDEGDGEVERRRRLGDATLLVGEGDDPRLMGCLSMSAPYSPGHGRILHARDDYQRARTPRRGRLVCRAGWSSTQTTLEPRVIEGEQLRGTRWRLGAARRRGGRRAEPLPDRPGRARDARPRPRRRGGALLRPRRRGTQLAGRPHVRGPRGRLHPAPPRRRGAHARRRRRRPRPCSSSAAARAPG